MIGDGPEVLAGDRQHGLGDDRSVGPVRPSAPKDVERVVDGRAGGQVEVRWERSSWHRRGGPRSYVEPHGIRAPWQRVPRSAWLDSSRSAGRPTISIRGDSRPVSPGGATGQEPLTRRSGDARSRLPVLEHRRGPRAETITATLLARPRGSTATSVEVGNYSAMRDPGRFGARIATAISPERSPMSSTTTCVSPPPWSDDSPSMATFAGHSGCASIRCPTPAVLILRACAATSHERSRESAQAG